jgi:dihydroorotate dehydrogenase (fumarate)
MQYQVRIGSVVLEHPLMNAAGTVKNVEEVRLLAKSSAAAIMVGSITVLPRPGNSGNVYWCGDMYSVNSLGLPNLGKQYYSEYLPQMADLAHQNNKPLFVSVAGFTPKEYAELAWLAYRRGADVIELNLGCPNVWQGVQQKRIACFSRSLVVLILKEVEARLGTDVTISVKISPFSDPFALAEIADALNRNPIVKAVTAVNTFPNALAVDGLGHPRITPAEGLAGLAGPAMKPIGLGQVHQLSRLLSKSISIIGVGGIRTGQDVLHYTQHGASVTQIATSYLEHGERIFDTILAEFVTLTE